jgi:glycosyltransferase involved in cell wall biosynthesis
MILRRMDAVVCVSKAQAEKVLAAGVAESKCIVIRNAIGEEAFVGADAEKRAEMERWFARPPRWIIGAAGRLSPEKGFGVFAQTAQLVLRERPDAGFVLFGDGPLRSELEQMISTKGLRDRFVFAGFRDDLSPWLPNLDLHVMSSFTEGLPVILLEASAAGITTVATNVGGIPEVIEDGKSGFLVSPGDASSLARQIVRLIDESGLRQSMGDTARETVRRYFSFANMSRAYHDLFRGLIGFAPRETASELR